MAEPCRVFGLPPGVDFPAELVAGLRARLAGQPPEAMARVTLFVNTERMRRRIVAEMTDGGAMLLPRIRLVSDVAAGLPLAPAVPALRRRLELAQLIGRLIDREPDIAPRSAVYDLADSLAGLMDEMAGEGVAPERVAGLDVSDHSAHWRRMQSFLAIIAPYLDAGDGGAQAQTRAAVQALCRRWDTSAPQGPVLVAGSTGSRGTTAMLMQAVARLPGGAIVLPGFDFDMPQPVWDGLADALTGEDHPQFRFQRLLSGMGRTAVNVARWTKAEAPAPGRNRLVSLSLRPAPVTDQWLAEGGDLGDLVTDCAAMTLIEAPSPRAEALAIALILRQAAGEGRRVALVSPDRMLTRQVTAALDRWGIVPDDSAGRPLLQSAPGRFLRHVSDLFGQRLGAEALLILLKHPLTHSGADRGEHLRHARDLELRLRRKGPAFPDAVMLRHWAGARDAGVWGDWLAGCLEGPGSAGAAPLADHVARHLALAEALAGGSAGDDSAGGQGALWLEAAGEKARAVMDELAAEAPHGGAMTPAEYTDLVTALLSEAEVRDPVTADPRVMIWGTLEARVQGADLVILGGLNDGIWPPSASPDPWLNRQMRHQAGLLLPERRIGLSAHDYQQAIAAPEVVLTRALRDSEAETVPSRWINRLVNLMSGLPGQKGPEALTAMRHRGRLWLDLAARIEAPRAEVPRAPRPSPCLPVAARPRDLPVTGITTLIRDPYAIYARRVLDLRPLDPLRQTPDARLRGSVLHKVFQAYAADQSAAPARDRLMSAARRVLEAEVPWPAAHALWLARLDRAADWFVAFEAAEGGTPMLVEQECRITLPGLDFTLTARPDRIDRLADGRLHLIDYKTGSPPTKDQQRHFDKQLALEAAMALRGAFTAGDPADVAQASYVGLGATQKIERVEVDDDALAAVWHGLEVLIARYQRPEQGYASRRAVFKERFPGDYDHLARYGEWDMSDAPVILPLGATEPGA